MGSSYANLTVVGATTGAVVGALSDQPALVARLPGGAVGVFPADEEDGWPLLGQHLSAALRTAVVGALAVENDGDDVLNVLTWIDGELVDDLCVPELDPGTVGLELSPSPGHDARRLVERLGRGDAAGVRRAVERDGVRASERHAELAAALGLPTALAGWGHRDLTLNGDEFAGGSLISAP